MHKKQIDDLIKSIEEDYHGDLDLFVNQLKQNFEERKFFDNNKSSTSKGKVLINLQNINKEYKIGQETVHALKDVDLEIHEGEIVALVGPSGSGKSTLLQLIGGLDKPTSGEIRISDVSLNEMNDRQLSIYRNDTIGFIFQFFNLQPYLNIQENVEIPLIFHGELHYKRKLSSIEAVKSVGLSERINHLPNQLSGGQMQRVAIARAIVNRPKLILADEPTGNLDRNTGIEIINLIKKLNKELNTTVILVTHDNFIAKQADRIIQLSDGKIV